MKTAQPAQVMSFIAPTARVPIDMIHFRIEGGFDFCLPALLFSAGFLDSGYFSARNLSLHPESYKEFRDGKAIHSVTYPVSEVPESLQKLDVQLRALYDEAKNQ